MTNRKLFFTDLNLLSASHTRKVSMQASRSNIELRSPKGQKGQKKLIVRNSFLNTNQKVFLGYLTYL